ncbi:MAG TPA: helix-turn-helix domain-containing protein [Clostridiales bacterium]|nr:helix-turn-helix domain-containing protein [Clostridiales bacterium]
MFDTRKFGAFLARLRKNADMTQSELADKLNLTRQAISKYECGDSFPDISILKSIAEIFGVPTSLLIAAGEPTEGEAEILESVLAGRVPHSVNARDVVGLAPYLKPSILSKLSDSMAKNGIDISSVVALAEYLCDTDSEKLLRSVTFDNIADMDIVLLEKLVPLLGQYGVYTIVSKVISGELDCHYLDILPLDVYSYLSYIESAVLAGAVDGEALYILRRKSFNQGEYERCGSIPTLFTCPKCAGQLLGYYPERCKCGHKVPAYGYTLNFAETGCWAAGENGLPDGNWLARRFGRHFTMLLQGACAAEWASKVSCNCDINIILADGDWQALRNADIATKNRNSGQLIFAATDPASPHIAYCSLDVAVAAGPIPEEKLILLLKPGGCLVCGNKILWEKSA